MSGRRVLGFFVARPLIAVAIAAVVVGVMLLLADPQADDAGHPPHGAVGLSDAQQTQLGSQQYAKTLEQDRAEIVSSGPHTRRSAGRQADRGGRRPRQAGVRWKVTLLRKNEANAYCLPGGKIVVYTGILPVTGNDAALATVLGHEVAHATAEHSAERIEREHLTKVAAAIVAGGVAFTPGSISASWRCSAPPDTLRFSRSQESEADHIGLVYMARAGYDPRQAVAFWKRMQRASKGKEPPEFVSDHPSDEHRIERIEKWLPEAERAYTPAPST